MKILMVTDDYLPKIGGLASHIFHISNALQDIGHEICVLHLVSNSDGNQKIEEVNEYEGVPTVRAYYPSHTNSLWDLWKRTQTTLRGIRHVSQLMGGVDLVHSHDFLGTSLGVALNSVCDNWVWTNHTSGFLNVYENMPIKRMIGGRIHRKAKGIISVSRELKDKTDIIVGQNCTVKYIPNGVNINRFRSDITYDRSNFQCREKEFVILCPRRMVPKNGVIYLAEAAKEISKRDPGCEWNFVFLGSESAENTDANYIERVKHELKDINGMSGNKVSTTLLGNIPMKKMPKINAMADVVVIPSLMEAVSLSALEAMATRRPIVTTNVGGLPEVVRHGSTGLLVEPRNPLELANALKRICYDTELRETIAENGYRLVRSEYSWTAIAQKTLDFYSEVCTN